MGQSARSHVKKVDGLELTKIDSLWQIYPKVPYSTHHFPFVMYHYEPSPWMHPKWNPSVRTSSAIRYGPYLNRVHLRFMCKIRYNNYLSISFHAAWIMWGVIKSASTRRCYSFRMHTEIQDFPLLFPSFFIYSSLQHYLDQNII